MWNWILSSSFLLLTGMLWNIGFGWGGLRCKKERSYISFYTAPCLLPIVSILQLIFILVTIIEQCSKRFGIVLFLKCCHISNDSNSILNWALQQTTMKKKLNFRGFMVSIWTWVGPTSKLTNHCYSTYCTFRACCPVETLKCMNLHFERIEHGIGKLLWIMICLLNVGKLSFGFLTWCKPWFSVMSDLSCCISIACGRWKPKLQCVYLGI